jgi:hypothetical protein
MGVQLLQGREEGMGGYSLGRRRGGVQQGLTQEAFSGLTMVPKSQGPMVSGTGDLPQGRNATSSLDTGSYPPSTSTQSHQSSDCPNESVTFLKATVHFWQYS